LISTQSGLQVLEKIQTKYGCGVLEMRNNFLHRNFSRFGMDFELKFREVSAS
jgi:hypothetical protein